MWLPLYRGAGHLLAPWLVRHQARRLAAGREDPARGRERFGEAYVARPVGPLVWLHAASIGESRAALVLAEGIRRTVAGTGLLITTGTRSAAGLLAPALDRQMRHAYAPYDVPFAVDGFLDHWRPDLAIFLEQELWPCMLAELDRRGIPRALCNARISPASFRRWRLAPFASRRLLRGFCLVLAASEGDAARFAALGAENVRVAGNLKFAAPAPSVDDASLARVAVALGSAPRWLAASIHPDEEAAVVAVHGRLAARLPGLITIVAPRHPARGEAIAARCREAGIAVSRHQPGELPVSTGGVHVADTLGEMGLWHRLAPLAFLGGTLGRAGGHSPAEAASLGSALLVGPRAGSFLDACGELIAAGAALRIDDEATLATALATLLAEPARIQSMGEAARGWKEGRGLALDATLEAIAPWLRRLVPAIPDSGVPAG